jgi:hypothetical protein
MFIVPKELSSVSELGPELCDASASSGRTEASELAATTERMPEA